VLVHTVDDSCTLWSESSTKKDMTKAHYSDCCVFACLVVMLNAPDAAADSRGNWNRSLDTPMGAVT